MYFLQQNRPHNVCANLYTPYKVYMLRYCNTQHCDKNDVGLLAVMLVTMPITFGYMGTSLALMHILLDFLQDHVHHV